MPPGSLQIRQSVIILSMSLIIKYELNVLQRLATPQEIPGWGGGRKKPLTIRKREPYKGDLVETLWRRLCCDDPTPWRLKPDHCPPPCRGETGRSPAVSEMARGQDISCQAAGWKQSSPSLSGEQRHEAIPTRSHRAGKSEPRQMGAFHLPLFLKEHEIRECYS